MEPTIPFLWILWPGLYIVYFILSLFGAIRQYSTGINLIFSCLFLRHSFLTVDKSTVFHLFSIFFLSFFFLYHTGWLSLPSDCGYRCPVIMVAMMERIHYNRKESIQHSINLVLLLSNISNSGMCKASFAGPLTENPRLNLLQKIVIMKGENHFIMKVNRKYKDRLFRIVFREKEDLLDLYNAVNGSNYDNPEELEIMTIEDVIYVHMKNDVAFLLSDLLNLWEHQSTFNPNMPARGLGYFAQLYQQYIEKYGVNLYSSKQKKLPFPQYIVFYNGEKDMPERMELRLSDAFFTKDGEKRHKQPAVEIVADMININVEKNAALMAQCQKLKEYAQFIDLVRKKLQQADDKEKAMRQAVDECIEKGILAEILYKNKMEVIEVFLTEYDEEKQRIIEEKEREEELRESWEAGEQNGIRKGSFETIYSLVQDGDIPVELGAKKLNMSVEEFLEAFHKAGYHQTR